MGTAENSHLLGCSTVEKKTKVLLIEFHQDGRWTKGETLCTRKTKSIWNIFWGRNFHTQWTLANRVRQKKSNFILDQVIFTYRLHIDCIILKCEKVSFLATSVIGDISSTQFHTWRFLWKLHVDYWSCGRLGKFAHKEIAENFVKTATEALS